MYTATLFDLAAIAPTKGEARAARAAERRETDQRRKSANAQKRWRKHEEKTRRFRGRVPAECCLNWYPADSTWTHCHTCKKPLVFTTR